MADETPLVYVVDDDAPVLKGLTRLLRSAGFETQSFSSPQEFLERHEPSRLACAVVDLSMPALNGLQLQEELCGRNSDLMLVFVTGRGDIPSSVRAMKRGAVDFLTKPVNETDLLGAVERAVAKARELRATRLERSEIEDRLAALTPREREVLEHVVVGRLNKQIAADLGTVEKTIKVHRARVMEKMKAASVAELVRIAARLGIGNA